MNLKKKELIEVSIATFTDTVDRIIFSLEIADLVNRNVIKPEHFGKKKLFSKGSVVGSVDRTRNPEGLKKISDDIQFSSSSYAIIVCSEIYFGITSIDVGEQDNYELYSARQILRIIRNAVAHIRAVTCKFAKPTYKIRKEYRNKVYKVEKIGLTLDTHNLHGTVFDFKQLGGMIKFIELLEYLKEDLQKKLLA